MAITIKKVSTKRELKKFIRFNYELYKENPYSVPDLYDDMLNTFNKKKNAAFEFCEAEYFLAYKDGKIVGRIAGIINHRANATWNKKDVRFGWIDFIDDLEVSSKLLQTVEEWGKSKGMENIQGPLGFTDFDAEGMLIEGFDQLSTMATIYNYPYYPQHMEKLGFGKDADWVEYKIFIPDAIPEKHQRISDLIQRKYNLKVKKYTSSRKIAADYGQAIFELMNEAYSPLYGYSPLSQRQIYRIGNMKKAGIVCGQTKPTQQTVYISYRHSDYATSLPSAFVISPRSAVRNSFISSSLSISSRKMRATVEKQ